MTREFEPHDYVTIEQAARLKGVSRTTIHTLIIEGRLPSVLPNFVQQVCRHDLDRLVLKDDVGLELIQAERTSQTRASGRQQPGR